MSVVDPVRDDRGWAFREGRGHGPDPVNGFGFLSEAYLRHRARLPRAASRCPCSGTGRPGGSSTTSRPTSSACSTPSSRPSSDADGGLLPGRPARGDRRGRGLRLRCVNNGVYRVGFAARQEAYDEAFWTLFSALDDLEARLSEQRYLVGDRITEADWRLFTTLVRFDPVYHGHFKCNLRRLVDYPDALGLHARPLPGARRGRDGRPRPHQAPLLPHARAHQPDGHRAPGRPGDGLRGAPHGRAGHG